VANHALKPVTALGDYAPKLITIGAYRVEERFDVALASLATRKGRERDVAAYAKTKMVPLPPPSKLETTQTFGTFWLSTNQWMIEAPFATHEDLASDLTSSFGSSASITEQTDAWVRFDLSAQDLQPLFERLCNVDLEKAPIGFASRTVIEHIGCYLIKRSAYDVTVYGPRSSAHSLLHVIETAAHSL
jgi:sarcosine oxidase, subunit gamma